MILAADIGGTHARLGLVDEQNGEPVVLRAMSFPSREFFRFEDILEQFLASRPGQLSGACLAVAGPVRQGQVRTTNLSWDIDAAGLKSRLGLDWVRLLNDLEAVAWALPTLGPEALAVLNAGEPTPGNRAVISAGTGLGEAFLYWDGAAHHPSPSEGSHADFAPRSDLEVELSRYLRGRYGHVSYERVVSGPGLQNVYQFLRERSRQAEPGWLTARMAGQDPAVVISQAGLEGKSPTASRALDMFVSAYGAEAGNLALKTMAVGGVFLAGGIAPALLGKLREGSFMAAFCDKGRFADMMRSIPVHVVLDTMAGLKGAARAAISAARDKTATAG